MKPKIKFTANKHLLDIIPHPTAAGKCIPSWFKKLPKSHGPKGETAKACIPLVEAFSQGFIIYAWCDFKIHVARAYEFFDQDNQKILTVRIDGFNDPKSLLNKPTSQIDPRVPVSYDLTNGPIVFIEPALSHYNMIPSVRMSNETTIGGPLIVEHPFEQVGRACDLTSFRFGDTIFKFMMPWIIETPKGWSCKFSSPVNRWENKVKLIDGVVDTDTYPNYINLPFVWTGDEEGDFLIKKGDPIAQVVPFKRQDLELEVGEIDTKKFMKGHNLMTLSFKDHYKNLFWNKRRD